MLSDAAIQFGILKCRDLVQLYYGARMVAVAKYNFINVDTTGEMVLNQDPRRLSYEIVVTNNKATFINVFEGATLDAVLNTTGIFYLVPPHSSIVIKRDFFTDLDAVCSPVFMLGPNTDCFVSTRETFLTPIPVDETP